MANRYGGPLPDTKYGFEISVEPPAGITEAAPIEQGDILLLTGTASDGSGYKVGDAAALDHPGTAMLCVAKHRLGDPDGPLGVWLLAGQGHVVRVKYDGAAPTVNQSINIAAGNVRRVTGVAFDPATRTRIMKVFTATTEVELLVW